MGVVHIRQLSPLFFLYDAARSLLGQTHAEPPFSAISGMRVFRGRHTERHYAGRKS